MTLLDIISVIGQVVSRFVIEIGLEAIVRSIAMKRMIRLRITSVTTQQV
jgi:hypothetical protein